MQASYTKFHQGANGNTITATQIISGGIPIPPVQPFEPFRPTGPTDPPVIFHHQFLLINKNIIQEPVSTIHPIPPMDPVQPIRPMDQPSPRKSDQQERGNNFLFSK